MELPSDNNAVPRPADDPGADGRGTDRDDASSPQADRPRASIGFLRFAGARRLLIAVLSVSLAAHAVSFLLAFPAEPAARQGFLLLVIASACLEIASHAVHRVSLFRVLHTSRIVCLASLFLLLDAQPVVVPVLLSLPYLVETALFDEQRIAIAWDAAAVLLLAAALFAFQADWRQRETLPLLAAYVVTTGSIAGLALVAAYHREENVRRFAEIRALSSSVRNLMDANMALQLYAHNIETESTEKERSRITRELHDMVGYALTNVIVMMNAAHVLLRDDPDSLDDLFAKTRTQAEEALAETRSTLRRLREIRPFGPIGLQAIWHLTRGFQGATGVEVRLNLGNLPWSFGRKLDAVIFRIVQEGLTNAFRHGKATRVRINLWQTEGEIIVSVLDNGRGVAPGMEVADGIGLAGMRERLSEYGGDIRLRSAVDGFELLATIPYGMGGIGGEDSRAGG
jgi:signal transduction histidine kinase